MPIGFGRLPSIMTGHALASLQSDLSVSASQPCAHRGQLPPYRLGPSRGRAGTSAVPEDPEAGFRFAAGQVQGVAQTESGHGLAHAGHARPRYRSSRGYDSGRFLHHRWGARVARISLDRPTRKGELHRLGGIVGPCQAVCLDPPERPIRPWSTVRGLNLSARRSSGSYFSWHLSVFRAVASARRQQSHVETVFSNTRELIT